MAEPLPSTTKKSASDDDDASLATPAAASTAASSKAQTPLQIALRVMIGFGGLALLVGFFLPWYRENGAGDAAGQMVEHSGLTLATSTDTLVGTPAPLLFLVPALGIALTAVAFMGFRWSAQVAVGIAVGLIGYSLYVLLQMFVQHTALGLWIVAASVFLVLLLGVVAWMTGREPRKKDEPAADTEPAGP
ncbi:hypothetical protein [Sandaracinus amylolyticus]|uniref:Uncharacterized protein n=1 Tax=Sandaracinus amylolyticus TaxID=927083 RepID=A0A0F6W757_9BACT|nr:hypothetical protein [Sandaracinus amylolyticus]AKF09187.1 hypothetical protein DB32_006336 [Sandaracinus amylolyticus]